MKLIVYLLILCLAVSCSTKPFTLNQYANYPVKFAKQLITYPSKDFELMIPHNWDWKVEQYEADQIILGIDAGSEPDSDGFVNIISIQKIKGFAENQDLKSEYDMIIELQKIKGKQKIIESGQTNMLGNNSYFIHTKSDTGTYGEAEMISFISMSNKSGIYYLLTASASQTKDLKQNMAMMIQCLQTFKYRTD